jgi:hypothetical protein
MSTHEHHQDNDPRQRLLGLLQAAFTTPEQQALEAEAESGGNALAGLLAHARSTEDIDARYASAENVELGQAVERLVGPAPVTDSFKGFIAHKVREAHAWQTKVDDVVAPDRLGLRQGEGIFDPVQAKDIEGQTLRGYLFDLLHRYTRRPTDEDTNDQGMLLLPPGKEIDDLPPLWLKPGVRPRDLIAAGDTLVTWADDYEQTYGEDPGDGLDPEAYLDAVPKIPIKSYEAAEKDPKLKGLIELLRRLRDEPDQE